MYKTILKTLMMLSPKPATKQLEKILHTQSWQPMALIEAVFRRQSPLAGAGLFAWFVFSCMTQHISGGPLKVWKGDCHPTKVGREKKNKMCDLGDWEAAWVWEKRGGIGWDMAGREPWAARGWGSCWRLGPSFSLVTDNKHHLMISIWLGEYN